MRRSACRRCREKKLKCDDSRPCGACQKAGVECAGRVSGSSAATRQLRSAVFEKAVPSKPAVLEETNILDLSKSLLERDISADGTSSSSAIPGSHTCATTLEGFPWRNDIPFALLDQAVLDNLVRQYFASVNWFMHVIDEDVFWSMMEEHTGADIVLHSSRNFSFLLVLVWALGAHYVWTDPSAPYDHDSLARFRSHALQYVESKYFIFTAYPNVESVQIGILLGSFHLFNGMPNLGFDILGSTIKIAQLLGLHRNSRIASADDLSRKMEVKVWWALEIFEKYAAIAFGRPCGIDDSDCEVPEIQETKYGTTRMTYHREKCRLYRIVGAFLGRRKESSRSGPIQGIHDQLLAWYTNLPDELKTSGADGSGASTLPQMQAMALQLAYDNIQIVLHRQAVFAPRPTDVPITDTSISIQQLEESALRTAQTPINKAILPVCQSSHAAMHVATCLFTAGVVLSALQIAQRNNRYSDELLRGLDDIIEFFQHFPGQKYSLIAQCLQILQTLQLKCRHRSSPRREASRHAVTGVAESVHEFTAGTTDDFLSVGDFDYLNVPDLFDFASGSSLEGATQSWLWSDPEGEPKVANEWP